MIKKTKYFFNTVSSKSYWQYVLLSKEGLGSVFAIFGSFALIIESLDFFKLYTRDEYGPLTFWYILTVSIFFSFLWRRPIQSITIKSSTQDLNVEVKIADLFEVSGAVMISTNTQFESDVAGGKIAVDSLQGQFTAKFFTGNQTELINKIREGLSKLGGSSPYPMGTVVPISTHGKTFYFTAMACLNEQGNASTTVDDVKAALNGLWKHIREAGELQELAVPLVGTGRGRIQISRKKMIALIAQSFVEASEVNKFSEKLTIVIRPEDANNFSVNLYDVKDNLKQLLFP